MALGLGKFGSYSAYVYFPFIFWNGEVLFDELFLPYECVRHEFSPLPPSSPPPLLPSDCYLHRQHLPSRAGNAFFTP